jgi:hypothetical protein
MTDAVVPFTGWGRGTWGELAFGEGSITNAGASGQVGSVTVVAEANVPVTGLAATGSVGGVTVIAEANVPVTGLEAAGAVGGVTVIAAANVDVTGVSATGFVGSVTVDAAANVFVTGVSAAGAVGSVEIEGAANVPVTGLEGTGAVGSVTVQANADVAVGSLLQRALLALSRSLPRRMSLLPGSRALARLAKCLSGAASYPLKTRAISPIHRRKFRRGRELFQTKIRVTLRTNQRNPPDGARRRCLRAPGGPAKQHKDLAQCPVPIP